MSHQNAIQTRVRQLVRTGVRPFEEFFKREASAGILLLGATCAALLWANSTPLQYHTFWHAPLMGVRSGASLHFVVNDALMAVFFLVVGLEIKRELLIGELSQPRQAALPAIAAAGGAIVPALIYAALNVGGRELAGWGVPMATDIAFAVGVLALLGSRIPLGIRVFLTALAIADDLIAVLVIAVFYSRSVQWTSLAGAVFCLALLVAANRAGTRQIAVYATLGGLLWYFTLLSGVHPTVAGVALAASIPARRDDDLLYRMEHRLHPWATFGAMPLFALANAGIVLDGGKLKDLAQEPVVSGISLGLLAGKPLGITVASWLAVRLRWADLPANVRWRELHAASWLGGIGFTMSLFIANLAFGSGEVLEGAKLGIFAGSLVAGLAGCALLWIVCGSGSGGASGENGTDPIS